MSDRTCEQRIDEYMDGRSEGVKTAFDAIDNGKELEDGYDPHDFLHELILGVSSRLTFKVELGWGGPSDWLEVVYMDSGDGVADLERVVYHFADWFDHAERTLDLDHPLARFAVYMVEPAIQEHLFGRTSL